MNKIVVITGGSSGIGLSLRDMFLAGGDTVCVLSRSNPDNYENFIKCDVSQAEDVENAIAEVVKRFGRIDIIVNNAGVGITGAIELVENEIVQKSCDINFMGVFYCCKYALPHIPKGGKIINISSTTAFFALPFRAIYCANKAAVCSLSYGLRMELVDAGIEVSAMCPGDTKTKFSANRVINTETNPRYGDRLKNMTEQIAATEEHRMTQEYVSGKIYKYIQKRRLRPHYVIGRKFKFLIFLSKIFPTNVMLRATNKMFGGYKK